LIKVLSVDRRWNDRHPGGGKRAPSRAKTRKKPRNGKSAHRNREKTSSPSINTVLKPGKGTPQEQRVGENETPQGANTLPVRAHGKGLKLNGERGRRGQRARDMVSKTKNQGGEEGGGKFLIAAHMKKNTEKRVCCQYDPNEKIHTGGQIHVERLVPGTEKTHQASKSKNQTGKREGKPVSMGGS